uniref:Uncharacterized protein n=1 Tax=Phasianus colchicus TaxID=9054 RepID=A0A669Q4Y5_PHACC
MGNYERSDQPGWGRRRGGSERQGKRRSPSGAQEGRHYRHEVAKRPHSKCSETKSVNDREHHKRRRYVEEYRTEHTQGCDSGQQHREHDKSAHRHHGSRSSGHSGKGSYKRWYRTQHSACHHHHHSQVVCPVITEGVVS